VNWLLETLISNALVATLLAIVALLVGLVCRRPAILHALWLLVLLKLVTPPLIPVRVAWPQPQPAAQAQTQPEKPRPIAQVDEGEPLAGFGPEAVPGLLNEDIFAIEGFVPKDVACAVPLNQEPRVDAASGAIDAFPWLALALGVWAIGSAGWFFLAGTRLRLFSRGLRLSREAPEALRERVDHLAKLVGLRSRVEVRVIPGRLSPMVWGFASATLLVPEELESCVGQAGLDTLLLHELAHLRRGDHRVRWLEFIVLMLYWWHPVAWLARRELREAEEQLCDAWVVQTMPGCGKTFATALLDAVDFLSTPNDPIPPLASGLGRTADLKRRLTMILRGSTSHMLGRLSALVLLLVAVCVLPLMPGLSNAQPPAEKPAKEGRFGGDAFENKWVFRFGEGDELKKLQEDLEKQRKQIEETMRKLEAARRDLKKDKDAEKGEKKRDKGEKKDVFIERVGPGNVIMLRIEGTGVKPEEMKGVIEKLEKELSNKDRKVTIIRVPGVGGFGGFGGAGGAGGGAGGAGGAGGGWGGWGGWGGGEGPRFVPPAMPPMAPMPPGGKMEELEKKLERLMKEIESLRKEMRPGRGDAPLRGRPAEGGRGGEGGGAGGRGGDGGGPGGGRGGDGGAGGEPGKPGQPGRPGGNEEF
jgi:beta-lactamase regulating signal transducer with metallopeptidase domain